MLSRYGDVSIVDYKTPHLDKSMRLIRFGHSFRDVLRMGKDFFRLFPRYRLLKKFRSFAHTYYNMTKQVDNREDLKSMEGAFDVFVCGSDQIWNPDVVEGFDGAYFLDFVEKKNKIAYASSAGSYCYNEEEEVVLKGYLSSFSAISVRESNTASYLRTLTGRKDIATVIDPTLMLNKSEWMGMFNIEKNTRRKPYVFVYTLKKGSLARSVIKRVSEHLDLEVIVIDQDPFLGYPSDLHIQDAGPEQYIELIAGASFVITNSFHGTVFSTNFEVPFISIKPPSGLNRVQMYLDSVGLGDRLVSNYQDLERITKLPIDFNESRGKLEKLRNISKQFLDKSLIN